MSRYGVAIFSISPNGEKTYYPSISKASEITGICKTSISGAVNFGHKAAGMLWERVEPEKKLKRTIPSLKTCPFCGSAPKVEEFIDKYRIRRFSVECSGTRCKVRPMTEWYAREKDAIKAWEVRGGFG